MSAFPIYLKTPKPGDPGTIIDDLFEVHSLHVVEEIGRSFRIELECHSSNAAIPFADLIGKGVTLVMQTGTTAAGDRTDRFFNGIVTRFQQAGTEQSTDDYSLVVEPAMVLMRRRTDCRIFSDLSVEDILKDVVFDLYGFAVEFRGLSGDYPLRTYTTQFRETDYDFALRLMEEEGMFFFFEHTDGGHTLVIVDDNAQITEVVGYENIDYNPGQSPTSGQSIREIAWSQEIRSKTVALEDYDYTAPGVDIDAAASVVASAAANAPAASIVSADHVLYDYPARAEAGEPRGSSAAGARVSKLATVRQQEEESRSIRYEGKSDCRGLAAGFMFGLQSMGVRAQLDDVKMLTVRVEIRANAIDQQGALAGHSFSLIKFVTAPHDIQYRSERLTPRPIMHGLQSAVVVGPSGETKAATDQYGRVKVLFHWERVDQASCWLRVSQVRAGSGWGDMSLPHVGQEVLVDFLDGDPDRPVVTGRVYNEAQKPYYDPAVGTNNCLTVFRDDYGNELKFDATPGQEHILLHCPKNNSSIQLGWGGVTGVGTGGGGGSGGGGTGGSGGSGGAGTPPPVDDGSGGGAGGSTYSGDWFETVGGNKGGLVVGANSDFFIGAKSEFKLGVIIDMALALSLEVFVGAAFEFNYSAKYSYTNESELSEVAGDAYVYSKSENLIHGDRNVSITSAPQPALLAAAATSAPYPAGRIHVEPKRVVITTSNPLVPVSGRTTKYKKNLFIGAAAAASLAASAVVASRIGAEGKKNDWVGGSIGAGIAVLGGLGAAAYLHRSLDEDSISAPDLPADAGATLEVTHEDATLTVKDAGTEKAKIEVAKTGVVITCGTSTVVVNADGDVSIEAKGKKVSVTGENIVIHAAKKLELNGSEVCTSAKTIKLGDGFEVKAPPPPPPKPAKKPKPKRLTAPKPPPKPPRPARLRIP